MLFQSTNKMSMVKCTTNYLQKRVAAEKEKYMQNRCVYVSLGATDAHILIMRKQTLSKYVFIIYQRDIKFTFAAAACCSLLLNCSEIWIFQKHTEIHHSNKRASVRTYTQVLIGRKHTQFYFVVFVSVRKNPIKCQNTRPRKIGCPMKICAVGVSHYFHGL